MSTVVQTKLVLNIYSLLDFNILTNILGISTNLHIP